MWIAYAHYATDTFIVSVAYTTYVSFCHGHNYSCNEMLVKFHRKNVRLMSGHGWVSDRALNLSDLVMTLGVAKPKKQKQLFLVFCFRPKTLACLSTTKNLFDSQNCWSKHSKQSCDLTMKSKTRSHRPWTSSVLNGIWVPRLWFQKSL